MEQTTIGISIFGSILAGIILIVVGLAALKILSLLVNALTGRQESQSPAKVSAWSGVWTALIVTATVCAGLMAIAALRYTSGSSTAHVVTLESQKHAAQLDSLAEKRVRQLAKAVEREQAERTARPLENVTNRNPDAAVIRAEALEEVETEDVRHPLTEPAVPNLDAAGQEAAEIKKAEFIEANKAELQQLVARIGQFVRSNPDRVGDKPGAMLFGQTAKSDNGDVVVFQPSDEMMQQILGTSGLDLLKSFNSELPERIQQTYALIPLTPPVGPAVPVNPLLAAGGLETIANLIVSRMERGTPPPEPVATLADVTTLPAEVDGVLTVQPEISPTPEWTNNPDDGRIVARTMPILPGEDADTLLAHAINAAFAKHVEILTANMDTPLHEQAQFVRMELSQGTADKCIVDTFDSTDTFETPVNGMQQFQVRYALLEFPDSVDQLAVQQIRRSVQQGRIIGLGVGVGLAWLCVCSAGFGIRQWRNGTRLQRFIAAPVFAIITLPTLLLAIGMVFLLSQREVPRYLWDSRPVTIDLQNI